MMPMTFLQSVQKFFLAQWSRFLAFGRRTGWGKVLIGGAVLIVVLVGARSLLGRTTEAVPLSTTPQVTVASVADLSNQTSPLSLVGTVQSVNEATVNAESSGSVTAVYRSLGQYVNAGAGIAELENSSQRAAVMQ